MSDFSPPLPGIELSILEHDPPTWFVMADDLPPADAAADLSLDEDANTLSSAWLEEQDGASFAMVAPGDDIMLAFDLEEQIPPGQLEWLARDGAYRVALDQNTQAILRNAFSVSATSVEPALDERLDSQEQAHTWQP